MTFTKIVIFALCALSSISTGARPMMIRLLEDSDTTYMSENLSGQRRRLPGKKKKVVTVLTNEQILEEAQTNGPKPETDLVIETTTWTWFGRKYWTGQKGVILYKFNRKQEDKNKQNKKEKYIVKFITKSDGTKRSEPVIYEIESSKFKVIYPPMKENSTHSVTMPIKLEETQLRRVPEKTKEEHALIMADSMSITKTEITRDETTSIQLIGKPLTDVVVEITKNRRGYGFNFGKTRIAKGQIGVLMCPQRGILTDLQISDKYYVKIVLGKNKNLFTTANYCDVQESDFKVIHCGPKTKDIIKSKYPHDKTKISKDNIKSYLTKLQSYVYTTRE